tara:strand:+ start:5402 stop:5566 length:165 start_codon:yes stop_codon:yes gene_type:complete
MNSYNDIMKHYTVKPKEVNTIEKKHKKKKINPKKLEKLIPYYSVFGLTLHNLKK